MKLLKKLTLTSTGTIVGLALFSLCPIQAATFNFSYEFESGETLSGTVDGKVQADGDTVTNLTHLSATFSSLNGFTLTEIPPLAPFIQFSFCAPECTLSISGMKPFSFFGTDFSGVGEGLGFLFSIRSVDPVFAAGITVIEPNAAGFPVPFLAFETFSTNRWQVKELPVTSVPEPAMPLGFATVFILAAITKKNKTKNIVEDHL